MSNGLEREFPEVAWRAVPPIGPRGLPPELVRSQIARGRELRSRAIRASVRAGLGTVGRALLAMIVLRHRVGCGPAKRVAEREFWASSAHRA